MPAPDPLETGHAVAERFLDLLSRPDRTERLPIAGRLDQRAEIPRDIRRLIHRRDRWRCAWCGWAPTRFPDGTWVTERMLQLDHIEPWSIMGSDRTDNLRTLCDVCNEQRSNYRSDIHLAPRPLPIVRICDPCQDAETEWPDDRITVYCGNRGHRSWTRDATRIL